MTMLFSRIKATDIVQAVQTELLQSIDELLHAAEPRPAPLGVADGAAEPLQSFHFRRSVHLGSVGIGNQFNLVII